MRHFFTLLAVIFPFWVMAQSRQLIEIDANSFTPVQTDVITGVNLDKIGLDPSRRPCARIKMHVNRMTKEEIAGLSVRPVGGNVVVTKQQITTEGNGLIIEMTAKAPARFYLHHDKYGDSNEVSLDLEGDKEYKLEAMLNTTHSIVVSSNTVGAEVYIDDIFKGKISDHYTLTISDVYPGKHVIKVKESKLENVQEVEVNSLNIHFRINLNHDQALPQYLLMEVEPKNSTVVIDGKNYVPNEYGEISTMMNNGSYSYSVSAKDYHEEKGEFIVSGKKVELKVKLRPAFGWLKVPSTGKLQGASVYIDGNLVGKTPITSNKLSSGEHTVSIVRSLYKSHVAKVVIEDNKTLDYAPELVPNFANVTLTSGSESDKFQIFVNDKMKGYSPWSGDLEAGPYIFEARKAGYRSSSITKTIEATPAKQSYEITAPTPIYGLLDVNTTPANAEVSVDGVVVGKTPLTHKVVVGNHIVSISKEGFEIVKQSITIEENKPKKLNLSLNVKKTTSYSSSSSSSYSSSSSSSSSESSNSKYCLIKYVYNNAIVYVNGQYKGYANRSYPLKYGNNYVVVNHNGSYYGRTFYISGTSGAVLNMAGAPKVNSVYSSGSSSISTGKSSSGYKSSSNSSSVYGTKKKYKSGSGSWDSFNLGASIGFGYDLEGSFEFNTGLLFRLWRHDSLFNAMTGISYMRCDGCNFLNFPLTVNWNILPDDLMSMYIGAGTEISLLFNREYDSYYSDYYSTTWLDFPLVLQAGLGFRHHDINVYLKCYTGHEVYSLGIRYSYLF
ncbi:MAG: PEGA domain-containing protein [Alistipes sp.]|nr:PEGA domain-containing protein [Alistipes sp.]